MSQTPERSNPIEQPAELVSRFIDFTRNLFEEGEHPFSYSLWKTEMDFQPRCQLILYLLMVSLYLRIKNLVDI